MSELKITLKAARVNAGFTVREAAKKLNVSPSTIIAWEKNPEKINALYQSKISDAYDVDVDNIIFLPQN
nr:MAG TPA: Helix-turn-helix XRE-family like protein [Caudoviricetes sp.]